MKVCPNCAQDVRPLWPSCRTCGALLMTPPAPVVPVGAGVANAASASSSTSPSSSPSPSPEEQFFAPAVLQPIVQLPPAPRPAHSSSTAIAGSGSGAGKWFVLIGMMLFFTAAVAAAYFTLRPAASAKHDDTPTVLSPRTPTGGLPTSLEAIVRIQAESSRHIALQTVEQLGTGDAGELASAQPSFQWLNGIQPSTDPRSVSVAQNAGVVTIAVAATNHDVCAFGQWSPEGMPLYVTMTHVSSCAAINAPTAGWSSEAGGAASDLPDDRG